MQRLRTAPFLARLVLAWFIAVVGGAGAAPLIHPQSLELVCGASGAVKLVVVSSGAGGGESTPLPQALGSHGLDCTLCLPLHAPPPAPLGVAVVRAAQAPVPVPPRVAVRGASWQGAALPPRGPPGVGALV